MKLTLTRHLPRVSCTISAPVCIQTLSLHRSLILLNCSLNPNQLVLDPRYFPGFFTDEDCYASQIIEKSWVDDAEESLIETMDEFADSPATQGQPPPPSPVKRKAKSGFSGKFKFADPAILGRRSEATPSQRRSHRAEWAALKEEPTIGGEEDPWEWWRKNQLRFPTLARMARVYLAIPGKLFNYSY